MFCAVLFVVMLSAGLSEAANLKKEESQAKEILTAIDVANLIDKGLNDADIAKLLSVQRGFNRELALKKREKDKDIIIYLLNDSSKNNLDKKLTIYHRFEGDKFYRESKYDKAASEYTLALKSSRNNYALYKSRGDSYKQYLKNKISSAKKGPQIEASHASLDNSRLFLCVSMYADYRKAREINGNEMQDNESRLNFLKATMERKNMSQLVVGEVVPSRTNAAGNIQGMRELDRLYREQRMHRQNEIIIMQEMSNYKQMCGEETASRLEALKIETDGKSVKK